MGSILERLREAVGMDNTISKPQLGLGKKPKKPSGNGLGSGYLDKAATKIKKAKKTRHNVIDNIMKDL